MAPGCCARIGSATATCPNLKVEKNQVYTIEPRLPVEGHGIATVEEIVAVDDDGCTWLSRPQTELYLVRS